VREPRSEAAYLQAALDCVIMADSSGCVVEFNPAAERTFGYARDEAVGRTLAELIVPPHLRERHSRAFARFAETGKGQLLGQRLELVGMRADGSEFPVELTLSRVEGEPLLICGALRDITERKRASDALHFLAAEQDALRRVATLVADGASPADVFSAVGKEVAELFNVPAISMARFEPRNDGSTIQVGAWGRENPHPVGTRNPPHPGVIQLIWETGRPARIDAYQGLTGSVADDLIASGVRSSIGAPIVVGGRVWGGVAALSTSVEPLPEDAEFRLARFTELVATAIANAQARDELELLADEQAALRRVATLVAQGSEPRVVFDAVCEETGRVIGATSVNLAQFTPDGFNVTLSGWSTRDTHIPSGTKLPLEGDTINAIVRRTSAPARVDSYADAKGELAAVIRRRGIHSEVAAPVVVEGEIWGALIAGWDTNEPSPDETESRLAGFAELVATAISNAMSRSELIASRARIVTTADETRRRIERDLHDGTQQQLVGVGFDLQALKSMLPETLSEPLSELDRIRARLLAVIDDVREISRGLHPALLSQAGLAPALNGLARRSPIPAHVDLAIDDRLPESIEIAAYYAVSEALANAAKHAHASEVRIAVHADDVLRIAVSDNGHGGAEVGNGSGLVGLIDRIEALGGHLSLTSPRGAGTTITIELPLVEPVNHL
jgi:PAS domain S-box-containing protein